jgi:hypothetical protein
VKPCRPPRVASRRHPQAWPGGPGCTAARPPRFQNQSQTDRRHSRSTSSTQYFLPRGTTRNVFMPGVSHAGGDIALHNNSRAMLPRSVGPRRIFPNPAVADSIRADATDSPLTVVANDEQPLFLIVIDQDRGVFSVEGPMTDIRPWQSAARRARDHQNQIVCGPIRRRCRGL